MATVNYSVPEDIKMKFNQVFANKNKSHIIAELMRQAVEDEEHKQQRKQAINALLKLRSKQKPVSNKMILDAKKQGRS